jgi:hypothetical protein
MQHSKWYKWKFVLANRVYHAASNAAALTRTFSLREQEEAFSIYAKFHSKHEWEHVLDVGIQHICICGKPFTNSINGAFFRTPHLTRRSTGNMKDLIELLKLPDLCQECYYRKEWQLGKWCPKFWKTKFES